MPCRMEISSSEETMPAFFNARHARGWLRFHTPAACDQTRTIAANARSRDQAAGESARPTSSFLNLRAGAGARTRRQAQNANEAFCILLVIAVAHGERRQVGAIQRVLSFTADDRNVSFV